MRLINAIVECSHGTWEEEEVVRMRPKHFLRSFANSTRIHVKASKKETLILVALDKETRTHARTDEVHVQGARD